jgi:hypothetical protein
VRVALCIAGALTALCLTGPAAVAGPVTAAPGDLVTIAGGGGGCTLGFLFTGSDRASYMSTAGHCLLGAAETKKTFRTGAGPAATTPAGRIGQVVFAENLPTANEDQDYYDFALIRLDKGVRASAELPSFGAPRGRNDSLADAPALLRSYGQGTGVSAVSPERDLLATTLKRPGHVYAHGALIFGDSGAPVLDADGLAVGTVLGAGGMPLGVGIGPPDIGHDGAPNRIGRLKPVLDHASAALRLRLALVTSAG